MMRKISIALVTALICQSLSTFAYANEISLKINNLEAVMQNAPVIVNDTTFVDINEFIRLIGAEVEWDGNKASIKKNDKTLMITIGSSTAFIDGVLSEITPTPERINGVVMIPLRFVAETFNYRIAWDENNKEISLTLAKELGVVNDDVIRMNSLNTIEKAIVLSYDESLKQAIETNSSLKTLEETITRAEEQRIELEEDYYFSVTLGNMDLAQRTYLRSLLVLNQSIENKPLNEEMLKGATEMMMRSTLKAISEYQVDLRLTEESLALANTNLKNLELKLSMGLVSESEVKQVRQNIEQSKIGIKSLELLINDQKLVLNDLLGYKKEENVVVDFVPTWSPIDFNIETAIKNIDSDPSIKLKQSVVERAQYTHDTTGTTITEANMANAAASGGQIPSRPESATEVENALIQAKRDLQDSKAKMEKALWETYNNILKLETNQKSLELDLQKATDTYYNALTSFEVGMITEYEVELAKLQIININASIMKNIYTIENLKFMLEKPYLLTGQ